MSAASALISRAKESGISLIVVGDRIRLRSEARPPDDLVQKLQEHKVGVIAELQQKEEAKGDCAREQPVRVGKTSSPSSPPSLQEGNPAESVTIGDDRVLPRDDHCTRFVLKSGPSRQDLVRDAVEALKGALKYQVRFHLEGEDVRIEHPPQLPTHLLERLSKASRGIAALLLSPLRPWVYSNEAWL
jgi:hypothetical protein